MGDSRAKRVGSISNRDMLRPAVKRVSVLTAMEARFYHLARLRGLLEGTLGMKLRSALRRLAVTLPFFVLAAGIMRVVAGPLDAPLPPSSPLVLIVTTEPLHPPFRALELWNGTQGCRARLVTLDDPSEINLAARLGEICRDEGATELLLGGDERLIPLLARGGARGAGPACEDGNPRVFSVSTRDGLPVGVRVTRAPVHDLSEAWAFVEACRTNGQTLDRLLAEPMASRTSPAEPVAGVLLPLR